MAEEQNPAAPEQHRLADNGEVGPATGSNFAADARRMVWTLGGLGVLALGLALLVNWLIGVHIDAGSGAVTDSFDYLDQTAMGLGIFLILSFMYLFTGEISRSKMTGMVMFCYLFTILAIVTATIPFMFEETFWESTEERFKHTPIGILRGCLIEPPNTQLPDEIACATDGASHNQWVVNIGGNVNHAGGSRLSLPGDPPGQAPVRIEAGLVVPLYIMVLALMGGAVSMTRRVPEYQRRVWLWYVMEASRPEENLKALVASHGQDEDSPTMTPAHARENMVFQLLQVISAPLIAFTAYYVFAPGTPTASVLLGFVSGFASETILVNIRGAAQKLQPAESRKARNSSAGGGKS